MEDTKTAARGMEEAPREVLVCRTVLSPTQRDSVARDLEFQSLVYLNFISIALRLGKANASLSLV